MDSLHQLETVILLLMAVLALTTVARKLLIPYPILLVIGGLVLGLIPGLPTIDLDPDLVFLVFRPPILWAAAYFTSWREFRANLRPITLLAVGLVLATTAAVAMVANAALPGLGWALHWEPSSLPPMLSRRPRSRSDCTSLSASSRSWKARV
ncbi:MAG: cation:proton antiporter [Gammaproteobacteria bacterium]